MSSCFLFLLLSVGVLLSFFFFQAEDGIRDADVTGVQTCALPISLLPVVAAYLLTYLTLGPLKLWLDRAAPHASVPHPERFFSGGLSYPGGHLVNTIVWYGVLVALLSALLPQGLPPRWRLLLRVVPPVVVALANTYLGYHWLTDNLGAVPLALAIDSVVSRLIRWAR